MVNYNENKKRDCPTTFDGINKCSGWNEDYICLPEACTISIFLFFFQPLLHDHSFLHVGGTATLIEEQMLMSSNTCRVQHRQHAYVVPWIHFRSQENEFNHFYERAMSEYIFYDMMILNYRAIRI